MGHGAIQTIVVKHANLTKVGAVIRRLREKQGYSQERFAQHADIERARYGRIERGEVNLTLESLFYLAAHLGVAPLELLRDVTLEDCCGVTPSPDGSEE